MKKLLLSLLTLSIITTGKIFSAQAITQSVSQNVYTLATSGQCVGCDLTDLNSSQISPGAFLSVNGSFEILPDSLPAITDLSQGVLIGATFDCSRDNISLKNVNFSQTYLEQASFINCDLTNAKFNNAILTGADFSGSILTNTDFSGPDTNLSGANLSDVTANGANFSNVPMYGANLSCGNFAGANFSGVGFGGANLSCPTGTTNFTGASFADLELQITAEYTFTNSKNQIVTIPKNSYLDLRGQTLTNIIFDQAFLAGLNLSGCILINCSFKGNNTTINLIGANFSNAVIKGGTSFNKANLSQSIFDTTTATSTDFTGATLNGSTLTNSNFTSSNFTGAALNGSDVTGSVFDSAILSNASLRGLLQIGNSVTLPGTQTSFKSAQMPRVILTTPSINKTIFDGVNFTGSTLVTGSITNSSLQNLTLTGSNGYIVSPNANGFGLTNTNKATGSTISNSYNYGNVGLNYILGDTLPVYNIATSISNYSCGSCDQVQESTGTCVSNAGTNITTATATYAPAWRNNNGTASAGTTICNLLTDIGMTSAQIQSCNSFIASLDNSGVCSPAACITSKNCVSPCQSGAVMITSTEKYAGCGTIAAPSIPFPTANFPAPSCPKCP
jgi:uncharacterized protein YjbI with pentapeptide repeats